MGDFGGDFPPGGKGGEFRKNRLRHKLPTTQKNLYTKFHEHPSITLAYIAILVRTENRQTENREQTL